MIGNHNGAFPNIVNLIGETCLVYPIIWDWNWSEWQFLSIKHYRMGIIIAFKLTGKFLNNENINLESLNTAAKSRLRDE